MPTLRLDLHSHLKVAKRLPFEPESARAYARVLRRRGLHGVAITEHVHAPGFWAMYDALTFSHDYSKGRFEIDGALFYSGFELTLAEDVDVLFVAPIRELRLIDRAFPHPLSRGYHPGATELADTLDRISPHAIRIAAHPLRGDRPLANISRRTVRRIFDALEINGRYTEARALRAVQHAAADLDLPVTGGGDAHTWPQIGAAWTEVECRYTDHFDDLYDAVRAGSVAPRIHPRAADLVEKARRLKARIKESVIPLPKLPALPVRRPAAVAC